MRRATVEVAPGVQVATSRRYATTSTIVTGHGEALLVDPTWDADELEGIADTLRDLGVTCSAGLSTHVHYDHVLWHPHLPDVPRWATPWSAHQWQERRAELIQPLVGDLPDKLLEVVGQLDALTMKAQPEPTPLPWAGREIVLHEHDAHAPTHIAAEVVDARVLVAGDMLSDVELPMPADDDADLTVYLSGLDCLAPVVARMEVVIPGHGTPSWNPLERLDVDRRYLDDLLTWGSSDDPRQGLPGMAELHSANLSRARATKT